MSDKFISLDSLKEYNKQMKETYIEPLDERTKDCPRTKMGWLYVANCTSHTISIPDFGGAYGMGFSCNVSENQQIPEYVCVTLDGIEYKKLAVSETPIGYVAGNLSKINALAGTSYEDTGEPFVLGIDRPDFCLLATVMTESTTHSVEVYYSNEYVVKLDEKYLPNSINTFREVVDTEIAALKDDVKSLEASILPAVDETSNNKILQVVNGVWSVVTPTAIYVSAAEPSNETGEDGDLYMQVDSI